MPQGSHRGAPWDLQAAPREPQRCSMGPPGSPKGATEVPDGTSRQPQGSHRGAPWDLHAAPREPQGFPKGPQGIPKGATEAPREQRGAANGISGRSGCLILGVQVQDSESSRENLGVQSWESLMSDSVSPNMPDRIWVSQPEFNN